MAKKNCKSEFGTSQAKVETRYYTVGYVPNGGKCDAPPALHIKGRWLHHEANGMLAFTRNKQNGYEVFVESKLTVRGQTTFPAPVRDALQLKAGESHTAIEFYPPAKS
ncbi:SymE family type I addiction module toxin [Acerihabitans sp.]|uniref:SymE family type I addiction module toxin n=1 Tax=Acerihabitans sp. TaxID=2811394 RepID=UPI002ED9F8A0